MENKKIDESILQEIENLGPFFVDDLDMSIAVKNKLKSLVMLIAEQEKITFGEAYQNLKNSPVYSLLTDDYVEGLVSTTGDLYEAYKNLQNRKRK